MTGLAPLLAAVLLVGLGGLFAAVDAAISTASLARVEEMVRDERPGAARLARVLLDRPRYINLVVLLRITCEVSATVLLVSYLDGYLGVAWGLFAAAATMVVVSFVVIGVGPRTVGRQNAYTIALAAALPLHAISVLLTPISRLLVLIGNALTPGRGFRNGPFASEIELREVVDLAQQRGVVADDERRMIQSVFELGDTPAREVMVPRTEMVWIESDKTAAQALSLAVRSGHSRLPVIGENVDDVVGVVYLKDLVQQTSTENGRVDTRVGEVMRPAVFVPDSKPLDTLLREMQRDRKHMALLVDEYGAIAGLVTIEDVLEEIVGEINDEYDADEVAPWEVLGSNRFRVSTRLPIEDLTELYEDLDVGEDLEVDTVGGLLAHELGRVPLPGAQVSWNGLRLRAEGGPDHRGRVRIGTVLIAPEAPPEEDT
ncbi:hemolysin family protein [Mycolicibacterium frederiksbergense]|uniref:HlyC/CorC family transporter n=1 Tax=Mycolicibacterium frederiksbergense TaxID=117567 RepID=A0A6H0S9W7_9MYCO|nr:hemolysin family protein [Mycolicibacterium frederiksbergense]QIV83960.1 HlyC/CorC family transporter [Mycolicibacterium frederiksbergense]